MHPRRIVLAGGSGQVGSILARHFYEGGHDVVVVARRSAAAPWRTAAWDGKSLGKWADEIDGASVVINLAGRSVNCRYSEANRREIIASRTETTRLIGEAIARCPKPPSLWMNMSTATIYRHSLDRAMDEETGELGGQEPGVPETWKFSIDVATAWEDAFFSAKADATRKIALRSAMVMSPDRGGVFDTLLGLVRFGLGGASGSGKQYVSWIHDLDFVRAIEFLISDSSLVGVVNISSPLPLPNAEFMEDLRKAWGIGIGLPAGSWMLEVGAIFLRTETELILKSRRVMPGRLLGKGFPFAFEDWPAAAKDLVTRWRTYSRNSAAKP
ncbi:MAG: TIGR01777 family oxidoreductase [Candidatus Acidiferrales bacterium]